MTDLRQAAQAALEILPQTHPVSGRLRAALAAQQAPCQYCNDTGDVHGLDGEWQGKCTACKWGSARQAVNPTRPREEVEGDAYTLGGAVSAAGRAAGGASDWHFVAWGWGGAFRLNWPDDLRPIYAMPPGQHPLYAAAQPQQATGEKP